jgi:hypothetical protein
MSLWSWLKSKQIPKGVQPNCVVLSLMNAWSWEQLRGDKVRISVFNIGPGLDHAQAQALIKGKWTPLTEKWTGNHLDIIPFRSHYPDIEPYRYLTLDDWIEEQKEFRNK